MVLFKVGNVITGAGSEATKADEGASLTTVLDTPVLRVELALLVLLCTDAMRSDLIATFDPDKTHETAASDAPKPTTPSPAATPVYDLISFNEPQDEATLAKERARDYRRAEVESSQMQGLRRSALTFFDKWRASVMHRLCEVVCVRGEVVRQAKIKRKQQRDQNDKAKEGNSILIDFGGDPFGDQPKAENKKNKGFYYSIDNKLMDFEEQKRVLILHCVLLLLLSLEHYPAHSRVLLHRLADSLGIEVDILNEHEKSVAQGLLATAASRMDADESAKKEAANNAVSSRWKIGLAAVGGAVLIGVTGGLAAPLLAAGVGTVMGGLGLGAISGLLGTLAGSSVLVGSLFGAYGGKMTGRLMKQYAREVDDFEFIPIQDPDRPAIQSVEDWDDGLDARDPTKREQHRLRVSIGVSGWLNSPSDVNKPWEVIDTTGTEPFSLRFEMDAMLRLGNTLNDVLFSYAWDGVTYTVVSHTLLGALYAGLWPLGLVKVASVLDNPFSVAIARADKAGKVMARALIDKVQGERPVTLIGYSIGARVIYSCLVELANQNAFGLVESVIFMGAPTPSDSLSWRKIRSVVSARVVNVYSTEDYILGYLYRSTKLQMGVAGLQEVKDVFGIENVDMSKLVTAHDRYRYLVGTILSKVGFGDVDFHKVAEQERALEMMERKKKQVREHVKKHKKETQQQDPSTQGATEMIIVPDQKKEVLFDVESSGSERTTSYPGHRPIVQQRPNQHPQICRQMIMPRKNQQSSWTSPMEQEKRAKGQLSDTNPGLPDALPQNVRESVVREEPNQAQKQHDSPAQLTSAEESTFPVASLSRHRQVPTNMTPTPAAVPQQTNFTQTPKDDSDSEEEHKIQMRDIDSQKFSPPLEEMLRIPPSGMSTPKNTTATVDVRPVDPHDESEDEISSEFGELSMVEPVPLDDHDFN